MLQPMVDANLLQGWEKGGAQKVIYELVAQQKTVEAQCAMVRQVMRIRQGVQEVSDEVAEVIWGYVIPKLSLWHPLGGEQNLRKEMNYDGEIGPARRRCNRRKENAKATIAAHWGEKWEEEFDTQKGRLGQGVTAEKFLQGFAAAAKQGWPAKVIWLGIDAGYRFRILDHRGIFTKEFTKQDLERGREWLRKAEEQSGKAKAEVGLEDLVKILPEEISVDLATLIEEIAPAPAPATTSQSVPAPSPALVPMPVPVPYVGPRPAIHAAWDFSRACFISLEHCSTHQEVDLGEESVRTLRRMGFSVEQFGLDEPSPSPAPEEISPLTPSEPENQKLPVLENRIPVKLSPLPTNEPEDQKPFVLEVPREQLAAPERQQAPVPVSSKKRKTPPSGAVRAHRRSGRLERQRREE